MHIRTARSNKHSRSCAIISERHMTRVHCAYELRAVYECKYSTSSGHPTVMRSQYRAVGAVSPSSLYFLTTLVNLLQFKSSAVNCNFYYILSE